ncbi:uncharacterized protein LOC131931518 [Physella acuta]|uniref:uncharacterized protein LOC131931518 n=1 Tax=Physella acuta TaxID=109671 RepID=UPI0027DC9A43|nr:uncharacterized protein LOC131931518 [Physella acuta]
MSATQKYTRERFERLKIEDTVLNSSDVSSPGIENKKDKNVYRSMLHTLQHRPNGLNSRAKVYDNIQSLIKANKETTQATLEAEQITKSILHMEHNIVAAIENQTKMLTATIRESIKNTEDNKSENDRPYVDKVNKLDVVLQTPNEAKHENVPKQKKMKHRQFVREQIAVYESFSTNLHSLETGSSYKKTKLIDLFENQCVHAERNANSFLSPQEEIPDKKNTVVMRQVKDLRETPENKNTMANIVSKHDKDLQMPKNEKHENLPKQKKMKHRQFVREQIAVYESFTDNLYSSDTRSSYKTKAISDKKNTVEITQTKEKCHVQQINLFRDLYLGIKLHTKENCLKKQMEQPILMKI